MHFLAKKLSLIITARQYKVRSLPAGVVELVDTQVSDACGVTPVEVQVLSSAIHTLIYFSEFVGC